METVCLLPGLDAGGIVVGDEHAPIVTARAARAGRCHEECAIAACAAATRAIGTRNGEHDT